MRKRHNTIAALVEGARPNWTKLSEAFARLGSKGKLTPTFRRGDR